MNLETVLGASRAALLGSSVLRCAREAYAENAARFSDELGDNPMTFATCVIHNLRHLLDEALEDEPGVRVERPEGSFRVQSGRHSLHFYKGRTGQDGGVEIRFDQSRVKRRLVGENASQLTLFDIDDLGENAEDVANIVFVHVGDEVEGLTGLWAGAPIQTSSTSFRWLWVEQLWGDTAALGHPMTGTAETRPWFDESVLPDLIIDLREDTSQAGDAADAS